MDELKQEVINDILIPDYKDEVNIARRGERRWSIISRIVNITAQVLLVISAVLNFSAGFFKISYLSFTSGSMSVLVLSLLLFGSYCDRQRVEYKSNLDGLLHKLHIRPSLSNAVI